jgi:rod shape-determining protein MreC
VRSENDALKRRIAYLQNQVTSYQEAFIENQRLRRLLDFKKSTGYETIAAQVVVHDLTGWFQTLIVDKGFSDGVAADMPVVNEEGVIGRILDVSDHYSRVLLITDQGSAVDAIDVRNRVRGILCGKDINGCVLKYVSANLDIEEGDLMITSGKDGIFPKGLRLGIVHSVYKDPASMFQRIDVKPLVQLSTLEEVLIIKRGKIEMGPVETSRPKPAQSGSQKPAAGVSSPAGGGHKRSAVKTVTAPRGKHPLKAGNRGHGVVGADKKPRGHHSEPAAKVGSGPRRQSKTGASAKPGPKEQRR